MRSVVYGEYKSSACLLRSQYVTRNGSARSAADATRSLSSSNQSAVASTNPRSQVTAKAVAEDGNSAEAEASKPDQSAPQGAMTRRLQDMTDENLEQGGRDVAKSLKEAGFDEEVKQRLLDRIADANFKNENADALAQAGLGRNVGKGTRDIASAEAWTGQEKMEDAALRMLDDAHKKTRVPTKIPGIKRPPKRVDTGRPKEKPSAGTRLAAARDQSAVYSFKKDMTEKEREKEKEKEEMRRIFKSRFQQDARTMPTTIQGLTSLANERIEDAIARGQFKNLPRGKKLERDHNASNPFINTTEYFMNKIIQKQEIVPPWIEKQQELVETANKFRSRMRKEWRRHAARLIASQGGSLEDQIRRAEDYAAAEAIVNPPKQRVEKLNLVDQEGHLSQITLTGQLKPSSSTTEPSPTPVEVKVEETEPGKEPSIVIEDQIETEAPANRVNPRIVGGAVFPFRDIQWEENERSYQELAIDDLNSKTRSYNLMAPAIAKKPYFSLERELRACYADVAPDLPREIQERARAPTVQFEVIGHREGSVMDRFSSDTVTVYQSKRPHYGFKEFWRDLFRRQSAQPTNER